MLYDVCVVVSSSVCISLFSCLLYWHDTVGSLMTGFKVCKLFVALHLDTICVEAIYGWHALFSIPSGHPLCWRLPVWQTAALIATWQIQKQTTDRHAQKVQPAELHISSAACDLTVGGRGSLEQIGCVFTAVLERVHTLPEQNWINGQ